MAKERATADKVRKKLEAKSRVYDRIQQGRGSYKAYFGHLFNTVLCARFCDFVARKLTSEGDEMDDYMRENCLVDFDGKEIDRSRAPSRDGSERGRSRHMSYQVVYFDLHRVDF